MKMKIEKNVLDDITIVSGLPRSGTSMMMRMLEAGGMSVLVDNVKKPDEDNPNGYYEYEKVKKINEDISCLDSAKGKAVKMVYRLLYDLPNDRGYKVIFMKREIKEILSSQNVMLKRKGRGGGGIVDNEMERLYHKELNDIEKWLSEKTNMAVLYVKYNDVVKSPLKYAKIVNHFLGNKWKYSKMAKVVDRSLYRQRSEM